MILAHFSTKSELVANLALKAEIQTFFFKKRKSMSKLKIFKNRYYEMKAHARKIFSRCYHILKIIFIFERFFNFLSQAFSRIFYAKFIKDFEAEKTSKKLFLNEF